MSVGCVSIRGVTARFEFVFMIRGGLTYCKCDAHFQECTRNAARCHQICQHFHRGKGPPNRFSLSRSTGTSTHLGRGCNDFSRSSSRWWSFFHDWKEKVPTVTLCNWAPRNAGTRARWALEIGPTHTEARELTSRRLRCRSSCETIKITFSKRNKNFLYKKYLDDDKQILQRI